MKRKILFLILILMIVCIPATSVYASLAGSAQAESGSKPSPVTPGDNGPTSTSPPPYEPSDPSTPSGPERRDVYHYTYIQGNVYEDLGYTSGGAKFNKDDEKTNFPISNILVVLKQGDNIVSTTTTDAEGNYRFEPGPRNIFCRNLVWRFKFRF